MLINKDACLSLLNSLGYTPLMYAAESNQHDVVRILLEGGAEAETGPPLLIAAQNNSVQVSFSGTSLTHTEGKAAKRLCCLFAWQGPML